MTSNGAIDYNDIMARLNIRNLPEEVHRSLRVRAARAGRSMEAEAREILTAAILADSTLTTPSALCNFVHDLYQGQLPVNVVDSLIAERRKEAAKE